MNRADRTALLDDALRTLDVAEAATDPGRVRADLDAILTSAPAVAPAPAPPATSKGTASRPAAQRRAPRRLALAGAAAGVLTVGLVLAPPLTGGDEAFASWTAQPQALAAEQRPGAAESCRENLADGAGADDTAALARSVVAVAESRGEWTTVLLAGAGGFSALCVTDTSAGLFTQGMIGSVGVPGGYTAPGPRDVVATDLGSGTMAAGELSLAAGSVGPQVVGVAYRSLDHGLVEASVAEGRFALWFPGGELRDASGGVDVEVTYDDGSTATARLAL
jgi:hypothetical protein